MKQLVIGTLLLIMAAPSLAGYEEGLASAKAGNFAHALKEWKPLAEQGNAAAQYNLAIMYLKTYYLFC
ncbi:MAG: hypothetical protein U1F55_09045 [Chitinivorax sp.]